MSDGQNNECFLMVKTTRLVRQRFKAVCRREGMTVIECINTFMVMASKDRFKFKVLPHKPRKIEMCVKS